MIAWRRAEGTSPLVNLELELRLGQLALLIMDECVCKFGTGGGGIEDPDAH